MSNPSEPTKTNAVPVVEIRLTCSECGGPMPYEVVGCETDGTPRLGVNWLPHLECAKRMLARGGKA